MTIAANIEARDRFTRQLGMTARRTQEVMRERQMSEHEEKLFGWVYKQPGMATLEDCGAIYKRIHDERGADDATMLLQRFGIAYAGLSKLWIGMYQGFFDYARHCLQYGISPAYAWSNINDIPHDQRDRWLLWHAESDCLYEARGVFPQELNGGEISDVSGIEEYEKRFVEQQNGKPDEL